MEYSELGSVITRAKTWAPGELAALAKQLETALRQAGADVQSRVALASGDLATFIAGVLAVRRVGAVAVLLSSRDAGAGRDVAQTSFCLTDSEPDFAIVDERHATGLKGALEETGACLLRVDADAVTVTGSRPAQRTSHPAGTALLVYSSGTEGVPKGVVISSAALDFLVETNIRVNSWSPEDGLLSALPLSHMTGFVNVIAAVSCGVRVVASPDFMWTKQVVDACAANKVTVAPLVPYYLKLLLAQPSFASLESLRLVVLSTAPINPQDVRTALDKRPTLRVVNAYGLTEALRCLVLPSTEIPDGLPSVGRPVEGLKIELRDEEGRPVAGGESGIAWVQGPNLMTGYWKRPDDTKSVLKDGWFCTQDVMRVDEQGRYFITGRAKELINGGGEKLSPEALERLIASHCPVDDVIAFGLPTGRDFDEVVVLAAPRRGTTLTVEEVRAACAGGVHSAFLPSHLMVVPSIPRNSMGKPDRKAARAMFAAKS